MQGGQSSPQSLTPRVRLTLWLRRTRPLALSLPLSLMPMNVEVCQPYDQLLLRSLRPNRLLDLILNAILRLSQLLDLSESSTVASSATITLLPPLAESCNFDGSAILVFDQIFAGLRRRG